MSNTMNAWLSNTAMNLKLTFRDRQAIFWTYIFPLFFLFLFASVFTGGKAERLPPLMAGLLCISAMSAGFFGLSIGLVVMRERGVLRRYQLTPIRPWMIISSELAASYVVLLTTIGLQLAIAMTYYRMRINGNPLVLLIALSVGALAFLAIGFIIASIAENAKSAQVMSNILFFPLMFLGGAAFPLEFLPPAVRNISRLLPSRYMVESLRRVIVEGQGLRTIAPGLAVLGVTFVIAIFVAAKLFRWDSREPMPLKQKAWASAVVAVFAFAALLVR
jgi:ABC-2 type transport system permease protein